MLTAAEFVGIVRKHERFARGLKDGLRADLKHVNLAGLRLTNLNLRGAVLAGSDFSNCILVGTDFTRADLFGSCFESADCTRVSFERADLRGADFQNATLSAAANVIKLTASKSNRGRPSEQLRCTEAPVSPGRPNVDRPHVCL